MGGSTNINDRSLVGNRDSEMNIVIEDAQDGKGKSDIRRVGMAGGVAANLRKALFAQHMGWSSSEVDEVYADPVAEETLAEIRRIASHNTSIYEDVFGTLPSNQVLS